MKLSLKLIAIAVVFLLSSCDKEGKDIQRQMIYLTKTSGWKVAKLEKLGTDKKWLDITSTINALDADDFYVFDPFGNYWLDEGPLKFPGDPQIPYTATWYFKEDGAKIQIVDTSGPGDLYEINELNDATFVATVQRNADTFRYTFAHP